LRIYFHGTYAGEVLTPIIQILEKGNGLIATLESISTTTTTTTTRATSTFVINQADPLNCLSYGGSPKQNVLLLSQEINLNNILDFQAKNVNTLFYDK